MFCDFYYVLVAEAVQIGLRDLYAFMPQKAGYGVEVCSHLDMLLRVEVAASMRRHADACDTLPMPFYDVFNCAIGQLPPMIGKKVVIIGVFEGEVIRCRHIIFEQGFSQNRGNRHNPLLMIFAIDKYEIIVYVFLLDATQFPTTDASFKECCYDCRVADVQVVAALARFHHTAHIFWLECHDNRFVLSAPLEIFAGVEAAVALVVAILNEHFRDAQQPIDITALFASGRKITGKLADSRKGDFIHICNLRLGFAVAQKEVEVIPITADSFGSEFADFDFDKVFSGGGANFHGVFLLLYVAIKGDVYITTKLMYVATRFQEIQKSRCSSLKTAGFAL